MIDWRKVLVCYMAHIIDREGMSYVDNDGDNYCLSRLSPEELVALDGLEVEAIDILNEDFHRRRNQR